jgi:hypothetical protein
MKAEGPAGKAWLCPACRISFLPKPKLSLSGSSCLADSPDWRHNFTHLPPPFTVQHLYSILPFPGSEYFPTPSTSCPKQPIFITWSPR